MQSSNDILRNFPIQSLVPDSGSYLIYLFTKLTIKSMIASKLLETAARHF